MITLEDTKTHCQFEGCKKKGNYGFPHSVKYVAWFIAVTVTASSSVALIIYGIFFGIVKTYLWITAFLSFLFICIFTTLPGRIFAFAMIDSVFLKRNSILIKRKVLPSLFSNPPDLAKKKKLLKYRHYNSNLYNPMPLYKRQSRLEDIKYDLELRNLTSDILVYLVFIMAALYTILINKPSMGFYSNEMISELILKKMQRDSISFKEITTYEMLLKYLNDTLLPALFLNSTDGVPEKDPDEAFRRRKRTQPRNTNSLRSRHLKRIFLRVREKKIVEELNMLPADLNKGEDNFDRGWTLNNNVKLMGKPRLRQIRVRTDICKELINLKTRNVECAAELSLFNEETGDFSLKWSPTPPKGLTESQASPWTYKSPWETATLPIFAKFSTYPAGGYILELARNIDDARIVLQFLDTFQWLDSRTRAVFIEFTIYCVNTNLFNVVTLIFEKSATGYIIPSYQIDTNKFLFSLEVAPLMMSVLFALFLFFFLLRECLRIYRTSFKKYLSRALSMLDLAIIFLGILSLVFTVLRGVYAAHLLEELEKADNNKFVSFIYAGFWSSWLLNIEALLVCLIFIKLFRLLTLRVVFFQLQSIVSHCYKHFIHLVTKQIILIIAFGFLFSLTFVNYAEDFKNFESTFSTVIGRAVFFHDTFHLDTFSRSVAIWFLVPLFFGSFMILVTILLVNAFVAVICLYFHKIRNTPLTEKYDILEFIKHSLTISRQKDIFHLKEESTFFKKTEDFDVMRLKGGGNKSVKCQKKTKVKCKIGKKKKRAKPESEEISGPVAAKNFLIRKPYDTTSYCDLTESRTAAMKNLTAWLLMDDIKVKNVARENAMKALFLSLVTDKTKLCENSGKYFLVNDKCKSKVSDKETLLKMRKTVENVGKEKRWVEDDNCEEEVIWRENNLAVLKSKLSLLIYVFKDE